jgi:hypothetical protein
MTPDDQIPFVNGLIENVRKEIVQRIETRGIPETWDGIELRELIADYFDQCRCACAGCRSRSRKRKPLYP